MRGVLDTNVVVSGIFWGGTPLLVLEQWALSRFEAFASSLILDEYQRVLRHKNRQRPVPVLEDWLEFIHARLRIVSPRRQVSLCRDPHDDKFLSCALTARADYIVSGDEDLLAIKDVEGIPIVTPRVFLRLLTDEPD